MINYIDTTEASKQWGISARRITQLAVGGRIEGAVLMGKTWLIPADAKKPVDGRTKEVKSQKERYIFPYPIIGITSESELPSHYNEEECNLCSALLLYESGDFEESKTLSEDLLSKTQNKYIRIGATFNLIYVNIMLSDFRSAQKRLMEFRLLVLEPDPHKNELDLLMAEIDGTFTGFAAMPKLMHNAPVESYSAEGRTYLMVESTMVLALNSFTNKTSFLLPYEFLAFQMDRDGYFIAGLFMHFHLAVLYVNLDKEKTQKHLSQATELAIRHNMLTTFSRLLSYDPSSLETITGCLPQEVKEKFVSLAEAGLAAHNRFYMFLGKTNLYSSMTTEDFRLASFTLKNYTAGEIAEELHLSEATVNKRFSALYKKLGVKSRTELYDLFTQVLKNLDIKI